MEKQLIFVDAEYKAEGVELIFYDVERQERVCFTPKTNHIPYFLVEKLLGDELKNSNIVGIDSVSKYDLLRESWRTLWKIKTKSPLDVEQLRDRYPEKYEDRIHYVNCFIYDSGLIPGTPYRTNIIKGRMPNRKDYEEFWRKILLYPVPNIKRVALDIEVEEVGSGYANAETTEGRIVCTVFKAEDKTFIYLLRTIQDDYTHRLQLQKVLELWKPDGSVEIKCFEKEEDLILETIKTTYKYPFLITYNGSSFDLKYLYNRGLKLGIPKEKIPIKLDKKGKARTLNTCHLDIYYIFYHHEPVFAKIGRYEDTTLDSVAKALLNEGQIALTKRMADMTYFERVSRCLQDATLTYKLTTFKDNMLIRFIFMLARISRQTLPDACSAPYSLLVKGLFDAEHRRYSLLIPSEKDIKDKNSKLAELVPKGISGKYAGGEVLKPVSGIYFDVVALDFPSMYPSIISTRNLSYETICCKHADCKRNMIEETKLWVCIKREGFLSVVLGSLKDFRVELKEKEKNADEKDKTFLLVAHNAVKLILNASYGVFGSEDQELYLLPLAAATTSIGRYYLKETVECAKSKGMRVIFGDTDSIIVHKPTEEQIKSLNDELSQKIKMTLDVGKVFRYVIMSGRKKNYLGIDDKENIEIKGLTGKKRHVCKYIKSVFQNVCEVLKQVNTEKDFETAKVKIKNFIKEAVDNLYVGEYDLEDMAFSFTLGKSLDRKSRNNQIYKAALLLGSKPRRGDTIKIVYTKGRRHTAMPLSMATKELIDINAYINRLASTMRQILEPMELDFDEIIGNKPQSLFAFQVGVN